MSMLTTGLRPGSRYVPLSTRLVVLFGRPVQTFGWMFFSFGMIFALVFGLQADWSSVLFRGEKFREKGWLTSVEKTGYSVGGGKHRRGTPIYKHHYSFIHQGTTYHGMSYRTGQGGAAGNAVSVEFPLGRPDFSRAVGMRRAPFGLWAALILILPGVGLVLGLRGFIRGLRESRLLTSGELTRAKLLTKEPTNVMVNKMMVFKLTFAYDDALGRTHQVIAKTEQPARLEDDATEMLFYDPHRPGRAVLLDDLPGHPKLTDTGALHSLGTARALFILIPPLLALLAVVIAVWVKLT